MADLGRVKTIGGKRLQKLRHGGMKKYQFHWGFYRFLLDF